MVEKGAISRNQAKEVLKEVVATGKDPETIIKEKGLVQISDTGALEAAAQEIIDANPKEAADFRGGKTKVMGFFVGQLMKKTKGQANPQLANEIFQRLLGKMSARGFKLPGRVYKPAPTTSLAGIYNRKPKTENRKPEYKMIPYCSICWDVDKVKLLDQRRLPAEELYLEIRDYHDDHRGHPHPGDPGGAGHRGGRGHGRGLGGAGVWIPTTPGSFNPAFRTFAGKLPRPVPPR